MTGYARYAPGLWLSDRRRGRHALAGWGHLAGAIGYDINCGVRLLASQIEISQVEPYLDDLASTLNAYCPSGVGEAGSLKLSENELDQVCRDGSRWALKNGYATAADLRGTEEGGRLEGADPGKVSPRASERGRPQLGTLGAGNHFIEVDVVDQILIPGRRG